MPLSRLGSDSHWGLEGIYYLGMYRAHSVYSSRGVKIRTELKAQTDVWFSGQGCHKTTARRLISHAAGQGLETVQIWGCNDA